MQNLRTLAPGLACNVGNSASAGGQGGGQPEPRKGKPPPPLAKQVASKIQSSAGKLTEMSAWEAKVRDAALRLV